MKKIVFKVTEIVLSLIMCMSLVGCTKASEDKTITWDISLEAKAMEDMIALAKSKGVSSEQEFLKSIEDYFERGEQVFPELNLISDIELLDEGGEKVYTLSNGDYDSIILYIHGGNWINEISPSQIMFCDSLAKEMGAKVYIPLYPLLPDSIYKEAYEMIHNLYLKLLEQKKPVILLGDSSGGNIALGLVHTLKENKEKMPDRMILISPCVDTTLSNPEMEDIEQVDPILNIGDCKEALKLWADGTDLNDPMLNPMSCKLKGYPKTLIFIGTNDIFYPDNLKFYEKLRKAGVDATMIKGEGLWHDFPIYSIPEKYQSISAIKDFCKE